MLTFDDVKPGDYFLLGNAKKISWFVEDRQGDTLTLRNSLGNQQVMVIDRKSTRLNSSHVSESRMPSSA